MDAADPQEFFWVVHSSTENPSPAKLTHAVNCLPHAAEAAELRSSKSSSKMANWLPFLETEGQSPPRARANSKKVSMITTFLTKTLVTPLPLPFPFLPEEVEVAMAETDAIETLDEAMLALVVAAKVVFAKENEELPTLLPLPIFLVVGDLTADAEVEISEDEDLVVFPALVVATSLEADEDPTDEAALPPFPAFDVVEVSVTTADELALPALDVDTLLEADRVEDSTEETALPPFPAFEVVEASMATADELALVPLPPLVVDTSLAFETEDSTDELA